VPFGSPDEVRAEVRERLKVFGRGGGVVFNTTHIVRARVPIENVLAMYNTVREFNPYSR
jgi:uroporphyrinogen-III decarboxylase